MRPEIVTFWHGPLDALRRTCLRSQVAAGHKVTVYSFEPLAGLPGGVGNAEAEAILPHAFAERLRPTGPDGAWRDWTTLQFSDFFRMRLVARRAGELHHALPKKSFYAVHADPKLFFEPSDFSALIDDPEMIGLHISPKGRGSQPPAPGSLYAWATERFGRS